MLQYPTNVSPENTAKPADGTRMSFTFNGDRLSYYNIKATDMATGEKIGIGYWGEAIDSPEGHGGCPAFNGDQITMARNATGLTNGHDYVWQVMMAQRDLAGENNLYDIPVCRGSIQSGGSGSPTVLFIDKHLPLYEWGYNGNDGKYYPTKVDDVVMAGMVIEINGERRFIENYLPADTYDQYGAVTIDSEFTTLPTTGARYQIYSNYLISPQYYFMCRALPSLTLSMAFGDGKDAQYIDSGQDSPLFVTGSYSQANNSPIKYYSLKLYTYDGDLEEPSPTLYEIADSGKIFSQNIKYTFWYTGIGIEPWGGDIAPQVNYRVICEIVTQDNMVYSGYVSLRREGVDEDSPRIFNYRWTPINAYGCAKINSDTSPSGADVQHYRTDLNSGKTVLLHNPWDDFTVSTKGHYRYTTLYIAPDTTKIYERSVTTDEIYTDFDGYYISALYPRQTNASDFGWHNTNENINYYTIGDTWKFICDIENTTVAQNLNHVANIGLGKLPSMSSTNLDYMSGTLSAMIGTFDCCTQEYNDEITLVNAWRKFISQPCSFLLKSQKGDVWIVNIVESPSVEYQEDYYKIPTRFTFSWIECDDVDNAHIYVPTGYYDDERIACAKQSAYDKYADTTDSDYLYIIRNDEAYIVRYIGVPVFVTVPSTLNGCPVVGLYATSFNYTEVEGVRLPDTIRFIE